MTMFRYTLIKTLKEASINAYGEACLTDHEVEEFIGEVCGMVEKLRIPSELANHYATYNQAIDDVIKMLKEDTGIKKDCNCSKSGGYHGPLDCCPVCGDC